MTATASSGAGPTVFVHVGAPKTGTTHLQQVLWQHRNALASEGILYPGERSGAHFHAALDLRGIDFRGQKNPRVPGAWERLARQVRQWPGQAAIISHELLAWATEEQVERAVESLSPGEVHVIYTARDLARQIPAVWQESVKNRRVVGFPRYLRSLHKPGAPGPWGKIFWGAQDAPDVLRRWGADLPPERMHLVTVPPAGGTGDPLWERFSGVIGLDPARYGTTTAASNVSLGRAEVELLRRVNRAVGEDVDGNQYEALFKRGLAEGVLAGRTGSTKITLPSDWHPWVVEQSERLIRDLRAGGYDIVGDLSELLPGPPPGQAEAPPGTAAVLDVAAETIARLVVENVEQRENKSGTSRVSRASRALTPSWERRARGTRRRLRQATRRWRPRG